MNSYLIFCVVLNYFINFPIVWSSSQSGNQDLFLGEYEIPHKKTPGPLNIETDEVKTIVLSPIQIKSILNEEMKLVNNGVSVEAVITPKTRTTLTGGPFLDKIYKYYKIRYYWSGNSTGPSATTIDDKGGAPIEAVTYWYNGEYQSFKNALNYRDGLAVLSTRIRAWSLTNRKFTKFQKKLKKITEPGSSEKIKHKYTFTWFNNLPNTTTYFAYPGSYTNQQNGKKYYCATVCIFEPITSFIATPQFEDSFGRLQNRQGDHLTNSVQQYPTNDRPIIQSSGFLQKNYLY